MYPSATVTGEVIAGDQSNSVVIMIFILHGNDHETDPLPTRESLVYQYRDNPKFVCHTVDFESEMQSDTAGTEFLERMTGFELKQVFG